jgi:hypothetical protein
LLLLATVFLTGCSFGHAAKHTGPPTPFAKTDKMNTMKIETAATNKTNKIEQLPAFAFNDKHDPAPTATQTPPDPYLTTNATNAMNFSTPAPYAILPGKRPDRLPDRLPSFPSPGY